MFLPDLKTAEIRTSILDNSLENGRKDRVRSIDCEGKRSLSGCNGCVATIVTEPI